MFGFGLTDVFAVYLLTASSEYSVAPPIDYSMGFVLPASSVSGPTNANVLAVFAMLCKILAADGPHPPLDSATTEMNCNPWASHCA